MKCVLRGITKNVFKQYPGEGRGEGTREPYASVFISMQELTTVSCVPVFCCVYNGQMSPN